MSDITKNNSQISTVSLGDTINDWRTLTNDQIIAKLNLMKVYDIAAGTGLSVTGGFAGGGTGGTYEMIVSDTIGKGITIGGDLVVTGNVSFSTAGEVSFPSGLVNVNGDDTPVAGYATGGIVVGSYTGPDFNTGTTAPFFLNLGGAWFTNQDLKLIGGGTFANASMQQILLGEANGKTLAFKQNIADLIIGNGHTLDTIPVGSTLSGEIARIRSYDGRVDILRGVNKRRISGISHGFIFGHVVRASSADPNGFTLAFGGGGSTLAEAVGMVSRTNGDSDFEITFNGEVEGNFTTVSGGVLSVGCPYFLSPLTKGFITTTEPNTPGHVSKPVLVGLGTDRGLFTNYRGQEINSFASSGGGGGGATAGRSIRMPKPSGFAVGDLIGMDENGSYVKLTSPNDAARTVGLVVNDSELLLYGLTEATDTFNLETHVTNWNAGTSDPVLFADYVNGSLLGTTPSVGQAIPLAERLGASFQIFFFNTRPAQGYILPGESELNNTQRNAQGQGFTAETFVGSNDGSSAVQNILVNGSFDVWQRGIGVSGAHTGTADTYLADRWYRKRIIKEGATSGAAGETAEIERIEFNEGQIEVLGNPKYYTRLKQSHIPSAGGQSAGDYIAWRNVIEDANTLAGQSAVISFYIRGATGVTGFIAPEYTQYWQGSAGGTQSNQLLPLIYLDGEYKWTRYAINFAPKEGPTGSGLIDRDKSWSEISILPYRFNGITGPTAAADVFYQSEVSLAQFKMEAGFKVTNPTRPDIDTEVRRCKRFYQTSYSIDNYVGQSTMDPILGVIPDAGIQTINMLDNSSTTIVRLPVEMRSVPSQQGVNQNDNISVEVYSPTGVKGILFNLSAGVDIDKVSSSTGFNGADRESGTSRDVSANSLISTHGFRVQILKGWVFGDVLGFHYVVKSEFNTGVLT